MNTEEPTSLLARWTYPKADPDVSIRFAIELSPWDEVPFGLLVATALVSATLFAE